MTNYGYHITNKSNINSILKNGLVPNIGKNSRYVKEQNFLLYFTTYNNIDTWIERFNLDKNEIVILKFPYDKFGQRYDSANDYFTFNTISPKNISLIDDNKELPLNEFYQINKSVLELESLKKVNELLKRIIERLKQIEFVSLDSEDTWDYNEADPNLIDILEVLKLVRSLDCKNQYQDILNSIKNQTLKKLCTNNLEITSESKIYNLITEIFTDSLSDNPKFNLIDLNIATVLISVCLLYRQLTRYNRTGKKYGDDNRIWDIDTLNREPISDIINQNIYLKAVMEETFKKTNNNKIHLSTK